MKNSIFIFVLLVFTSTFSQSNKNDIWDALLKNDRETALKLTSKINPKKADIESIIIKQMVNIESGIYKVDQDFIESFVTKPDFEYYLFALWNEPYIFSDYLKQGFKKQIYDNVDFINNISIKDPTVKNALIYLKAVANRGRNDFDGYYSEISKIPAISEWQYCGVFENLNQSGIDVVYPPEEFAISKEPFNANSNGYVNWYTPLNKDKEPYQFFTNHLEYGDGINYAQTFINAPENQTAYLNLGIGKATKVWLNDVLIFEQNKDRITDLDAFIIKINIPKGNNRLLVKTTNSSYSYFIIRLLDENGKPLSSLNYTRKYTDYNKSIPESIQAAIQPNRFEEFFKAKVLENPNNFFYKYALIKTYLRNSKEAEANEIIFDAIKKHPKSSFLRKILIDTYSLEEDYTSLNKVKENIENDDEDYYFTQILKFMDTKELFRLDVEEMNKSLEKIKESTDLVIINHSCDFLMALREENKSKVYKLIEVLLEDAETYKNAKLKTTYSSFYSLYFNENKKTISLLNDLRKDYFYYDTYTALAKQYNKANQDNKTLNLYKQLLEKLPYDNSVMLKVVNKLHSMQQFEASLPYINEALSNFPYSFTFMEKKGTVLQQLKKKNEALKWYKKSLRHNSGKTSLRKKINDLEGVLDPLKNLIVQKPYEYIKENRGKIKDNKFGVNYLLDESNILLYEEGGFKSRVNYIFEVTSDKGVEILKEYNLGLSRGYNIIKSEIVKPDGSIVPAETSGSSFVFNDLSIGDVILIDYETNSSSTGRFYKDFSDYKIFDSFHPSLKSFYRILAPKSIILKHEVKNGEITFSKKSIGDLTLYEWSDGFNEGLPDSESYMPKRVDVARVVHVSTLDSWTDISTWYSDLVRSSIKYNSVVNDTFDSLFPKGFENLTEEERAKIIYDYIMENMNYSYVDFKQSGFIPQRPSKTINSKLGDCKDFSTLFLTLGRKAGLKVNLVLVTTNDYGQNEMVLPSTDFNHCIVKVILDGKEQFLELTDKYLPFKSLPPSLESATALEIPYDSTDAVKTEIFKLKNVSQNKTVLKSDVVYTISHDKQEIAITITSKGSSNSYFNKLLNEPNKEVLKKEILDYFEGYDNLDLNLISYEVLQRNKDQDEIIFKSVFSVMNKIQSLGKSKLFRLPLQLKPYTPDIINLEERKYPIEYHQYEYINQFVSNYTIVLKDGKKFLELPDNKSFSYKKHNFVINYKLKSPSELQVQMIANTDLENIDINDYAEYKIYVQSILEKVESFIGFQ